MDICWQTACGKKLKIFVDDLNTFFYMLNIVPAVRESGAQNKQALPVCDCTVSLKYLMVAIQFLM
jgi:hypothetical protein